ncbi:universal stress protein [Xinfangfangia pollutisoli]|uniref:universal stress protein n=1 Tax=Xinfangfangia pollutisoli TaxID=2865960 RepID=UPI001CD744EE|nr:universal stress protein [Xinfangfangia pollutisoli]
MAYKSLLTLAAAPDRLGPAVNAAGVLARKFDAHLDALALGVDRTQVGYSYVGSGAVVLQVALERAEEDARKAEAALKAALDGQGADLRWALDSAVTQIGALTDLVATRARYADLVVLPKPYADTAGPEDEAIIEAAMFEGMAPVLVVPEKGPEITGNFKHVVLAWNQSREAMVAAKQALPFLKAAERVTITVIDPPTHGPERSDPGGLLCQFLVRHGVKAEVAVLARTLPRISDVLARQCTDTNADLLVMGAYGHSRFREAILGGATRNMLEAAELPVFMAH